MATDDLKEKFEALDNLKELCDETEKQITGSQNDDNLIEFLKDEYPKLSKLAIQKILRLVKGKKESSKVSGSEKKSLENQLIGQSFINDVNPMNDKGKFVGYSTLKHRISQKKSNLKK